MGIVNPPANAIQNYLWVKAQEGIVALLKDVASQQAIIDPLYNFSVLYNQYRPSIENLSDGAFVNVLIGDVVPSNDTNSSKNHIVKYFIDCYYLGENEESDDDPRPLVPADETASQRLQYLCAMVESGLTALSNYYYSLNSGEIMPMSIDLNFNEVIDAKDSYTPYAPARFIYSCMFPYEPKSLENLPTLERLKTTSSFFIVDKETVTP
jgi:hypothetical protein